MPNFINVKRLSMKEDNSIDERWVQNIIADDPRIVGLGDVIVKDIERNQGKGRLDILLQDAEGYRRYEVEIQLGSTDESHIVRTIEYWDIERRKYPQYDHVAVIIAEDITSRFFNVINLFNGFIPIIAIQMTAINIDGGVGIIFNKVLDSVKLGYIGSDESVSEKVDEAYWEKKTTKESVRLAKEILRIAREVVSGQDINLNYVKTYIGFQVDGRSQNFATCRPKKKGIRLDVSITQSEEIDKLIEDSGLNYIDYDTRWGNYRININSEDIEKREETIRFLLEKAYDERR